MSIEIHYYKTNIGLFFKIQNNPYYWTGNPFIVNGIKLVDLPVINGYYFLKDQTEIKVLEHEVAEKQKQTGFKIIDKSLVSDKIPAALCMEEVKEYYDDDLEETRWANYTSLQSLYEPVYENQPARIETVDFKPVLIREIIIENFETPQKMQIMMHSNGSFSDKITPVDLSAIVKYSDIERLLTPEFLLHDRPCNLTSEQVYSIVRAHIKNNIVSSEARITSDYDFCFTVRKVLHKKPVNIKTEVKKRNGRSYHPPRFVNKTDDSELFTIFEMTSKQKHYQGYTPIEGWSANSLKEMQENIKQYLDDLMEVINARLDQCPTCQGHGCLVSKIPTNQR